MERNPFRLQPKRLHPTSRPKPTPVTNPGPPPGPPPERPPPIPEVIGIVEKQGLKVALVAGDAGAGAEGDDRRAPRLIRIGVESIVSST